MLPCALPLRISRRHTVREHYVTKAIIKALVSNREGKNQRKLDGRGRGESMLSVGQVSASLTPPQGPVLPSHSEKEHSRSSRKIHKVTKPIQREAAWAGKRTNSYLDTRPANTEMPSSPGAPARLPHVTLPL